ncbi:phosphoenolpyruvate synthase [Okeania sp. SIO3I5]|uniref:phosphoenolpyruvate synthase n=1 Tax=Okeania sp. SIO3I5 TaxID=2607805 RepID=UPI0025D072FA|nr:phosphoenolpyruvate synthase [Okeania sp. SIO3I5]
MTNILAIQQRTASTKEKSLILWFDEVDINDIPLVGGKNASLGEMMQQLTPKGINIPNGFATTAYAYRYFIKTAGLETKLRQLFADLDVEDIKNLQQRGKKARALIMNTPFPVELERAIAISYETISYLYGKEIDVAVRSSATAEDLPDASFAGQQETYLNIHGIKSVLKAAHKCFASIFTDRAISYRTLKGFDHFDVALSVGIQKMVRSDLATSGVMFSIDTETGFKNAALVTAAYGLGENVVQGAVNPDEYLVFKPTLREGFPTILNKRLGTKAVKMVYDGGNSTKNVPVAERKQQQFALTDDEILQLAQWAVVIEDHYSQVRGIYTPMDIEWAKDGNDDTLYIVQARPETVQSQKSSNVLHTYHLQERGKVLVTGRAVGQGIAQGKVRVILDTDKIGEFQAGEVLVTNKTDPDWEPIMKKASAIVTNQGGRTCHAAIIAREMGIPAIVGCENATELLNDGNATQLLNDGNATQLLNNSNTTQLLNNSNTTELLNDGNATQLLNNSNTTELLNDGNATQLLNNSNATEILNDGNATEILNNSNATELLNDGNATEILNNSNEVTVCCAEGEVGTVYQGLLPFEDVETVLDDIPKTRTSILMNVGNPESAFQLSAIPCDGVGLARLEFIIANHIGVHPLALLNFDQVADEVEKAKIAELTVGYERKADFFIDRLVYGIGAIAAAFYPKPVIVRMSDFKSNEYANLLGGKQFEPDEENPMIGWRGASRYYHPKYREAFGLECVALKRVRDEMGLANVIPMIPFCRTPQEGKKVLAEMAKYGLERGKNCLQVYVMCELPSNVILVEQFAQIFDGFSIGSNDLTQLVLGLDRDSALVADVFDERHDAVRRMIQIAITIAHECGCKIGICGQAPSDYPEFAQMLVELGIDSISLNPDSVLKTRFEVAKLEVKA